MGRGAELRALDVGNNSITAAGAEPLARFLFNSATLKDLNLYMNDLGDEGVGKLAAAVAANSQLTALDLGCAEPSASALLCLMSWVVPCDW